MTPNGEASILVGNYIERFLSFGDYLSTPKAKLCALIAIDFMIEISNKRDDISRYYYFNLDEFDIEYLNKIKEEINLL
jgi:hypothetical protein